MKMSIGGGYPDSYGEGSYVQTPQNQNIKGGYYAFGKGKCMGKGKGFRYGMSSIAHNQFSMKGIPRPSSIMNQSMNGRNVAVSVINPELIVGTYSEIHQKFPQQRKDRNTGEEQVYVGKEYKIEFLSGYDRSCT